MNNGPISVSAPGKSLIGATAQDVTFSTRYPFAKLDSTNVNSFQVITLFFNTEPPNPTPGNSNKTLVYSYPHGYTYIPSSWFLISKDTFINVLGSEGSWLIGNAASTNNATAVFTVEIDAVNVNFYISKFVANITTPVYPNIIGYFLSIRAYIFVEDLLGDSVPSRA